MEKLDMQKVDPLEYFLTHMEFHTEIKIFNKYPQLKDFLKKCFDFDLHKRPSATELLNDSFFE